MRQDTGSQRLPAQTAGRVLAAPLLLALGSLAGLVIGLTGGGWRDALCAVLVALPLIVLAHFWRHRR
jgi:uncharacterized membrane protein YjjP (DUF1212 family)